MLTRRSSAPTSLRRVIGTVAVSLGLGSLLLFGMLPRVASATPMPGMRPQVAPSMGVHAPIEIRVSPELKKVLEGLICQCGCNLDAYQCQQTMTCQVSSDMWDQAERTVDRDGKSPEQALQLFAADYGERVLASPTKTGFNLTAWILPLVALGIGLLVLTVVLRRWRPVHGDGSTVEPPDVDPRLLERIERELMEED